jgi:hypothetical protein
MLASAFVAMLCVPVFVAHRMLKSKMERGNHAGEQPFDGPVEELAVEQWRAGPQDF